MSRPKKLHKPIKGAFNDILFSIALGGGKGKRTAINLKAKAGTFKAKSSTPLALRETKLDKPVIKVKKK